MEDAANWMATGLENQGKVRVLGVRFLHLPFILDFVEDAANWMATGLESQGMADRHRGSIPPSSSNFKGM